MLNTQRLARIAANIVVFLVLVLIVLGAWSLLWPDRPPPNTLIPVTAVLESIETPSATASPNTPVATPTFLLISPTTATPNQSPTSPPTPSATETPTPTQTLSPTPGRPTRTRTLPANTTPTTRLIPDGELVNSPAAIGFDFAAYIQSKPGLLRSYTETVSRRRMSATDTIQFVSINMGVNPRLLLALLEYKSQWLTNPKPADEALKFPMGFKDKEYEGLFLQVIWAANTLNEGYYGWKHRGTTTLEYADKTRIAYAPGLNAGTVALQYFFARTAPDYVQWQLELNGFAATYQMLFGDPFSRAVEPLVPPDLQQPEFALPFARGEMWYFTAGPHGGWGRTTSGWSAVDFGAPPPPDGMAVSRARCAVSPFFTTAMAAGTIARSNDGAVVIDLDRDGDERTGWTILYLHVAAQDRVALGATVQAGSPIGHPSCEGFYLNALGAHIHVARRYNGEWIPADCWACTAQAAAPPFIMSGWKVKGYPRRASEGWIEKDGQVRRLSTRRDAQINGVTW